MVRMREPSDQVGCNGWEAQATNMTLIHKRIW